MTTLSQVNAKLRRRDRKNSLLLFGCILFATAMISAFGVIMQSDAVQTVLPKGGDSRKMMVMIFVLALVGCGIFTVYASSLFFRGKSRQNGIFMVLGVRRGRLRAGLFTEVGLLAIVGTAIGFLFGTPLAAGIWQFFRLLVDSEEMRFSIHPTGYVWGLGFAMFVVAMLLLSAVRFLGRQNIMDIIYEQRKNETVRGVKAWYGWGGVLMIVGGAFLGVYGLPALFRDVLHRQFPVWINLIYLASLAGLYLFLVYAVVRDRQGKNKYKDLIPHSMMKFQGRSTVRNMCVIALLMAGAYFASFYIPSILTSTSLDAQNRPVDFVYHHRLDESIPGEAEVREMAEEENVVISRWNEAVITTLAIDSTQEREKDDGTLWWEYIPFSMEQRCVPASEFTRLSGLPADVAAGTFKAVLRYGQDSANADGVTLLTNPDTRAELPVSFAGYLSYAPFSEYIVMNDDDFASLTAGLTDEWREKMALFNVEDVDASYAFAKRLRNEIIDRSSQVSEVAVGYDRIVKMTDMENGVEYWGDTHPILQLDYSQRDSSNFIVRWKYRPSFRILDQVDAVSNVAVFVMLFAFIAVICFTAVFVIAYTRCTTIAMNNRQIYEDLRRLGANHDYLAMTVKKQVRGVVSIPIRVGTVLMCLYQTMLLYFNSNSLSPSELATLGVCLGIVVVVSSLVWGFYRFTLRKTCRLLRLV